MTHVCIITQRLREEQKRIFRVAADPLRYGLTLKAIGIYAGIPYETLRSYANGSACMPVSALFKLCGPIPAELLSLLLPEGLVIAPSGEQPDHDDLAASAIDYAALHARARHPDSPGGVAIVAVEEAELSSGAARLKAAAA